MIKHVLIIFLIAGCYFKAAAQTPDTAGITKKTHRDSLVSTKNDSVKTRKFVPKPKKEKVYHPDSTHSPHTAIIRSIIIPGWGQVYNHRWWKVPLIYGGLGLLGYAEVYNAHYYNEFLAVSKYVEHGTMPKLGDKYYLQYTEYVSAGSTALYDATDGYRRDRDLCILGIIGAWGINVIDAYIDAKFMHSYSMDNNLSIKIKPGLINQPVFAQNISGSYIPGIKVTFMLR